MSPYNPAEQAALIEQLTQGVSVPVCPACGTRCTLLAAHPRGDVAYVRRRIVIRCPSCMKSLGLDAHRVETSRSRDPGEGEPGEPAD